MQILSICFSSIKLPLNLWIYVSGVEVQPFATLETRETCVILEWKVRLLLPETKDENTSDGEMRLAPDFSSFLKVVTNVLGKGQSHSPKTYPNS